MKPFFLIDFILAFRSFKLIRLIFLNFKFLATAVEDDDDEEDEDDDEEDSDEFSDNENSEEMVDEENKDFGLKSLLEEDDGKKSQVRDNLCDAAQTAF